MYISIQVSFWQFFWFTVLQKVINELLAFNGTYPVIILYLLEM